ncbi:carbohydrate-binding module family 50 protein, partial [Glonium stellatum]
HYPLNLTMSLLLARTGPQGPTAPGIAANCNKYVLIQEGNSCEAVANQAGVTLDEFYAWNPSLQYSCVNLVIGDSYCVGVS